MEVRGREEILKKYAEFKYRTKRKILVACDVM